MSFAQRTCWLGGLDLTSGDLLWGTQSDFREPVLNTLTGPWTLTSMLRRNIQFHWDISAGLVGFNHIFKVAMEPQILAKVIPNLIPKLIPVAICGRIIGSVGGRYNL